MGILDFIESSHFINRLNRLWFIYVPLVEASSSPPVASAPLSFRVTSSGVLKIIAVVTDVSSS
jgi:hypothetical protein